MAAQRGSELPEGLSLIKALKNTLCSIVAAFSTSCAHQITLKNTIEPDEYEVSIQKSWHLIPKRGDIHQRTEEGADFGVSNADKNFWFTTGLYTERFDGISHLTLFPRFTYVPFSYCAFECDKKTTRTSFEARAGGGAIVSVARKKVEIKTTGTGAEFLKVEPPLYLPEYDVDADITLVAEAALRFGILQGTYTFAYIPPDEFSNVFGIGGRY